MLDILDAKTFAIHAVIALSKLHVSLNGRDLAPPLGKLEPDGEIDVDCSAGSAVAVMRTWVGNHSVIKAFDLEKGSETADLTGSFDWLWGSGIGVSPDGSKVAAEVDGGPQEVLEIVDRLTGKQRKLEMGSQLGQNHYQLAFAGEAAVVIGQSGCQLNQGYCEVLGARGRTIRVFDLTTSSQKAFAVKGAEAYRFSGASEDGQKVFGYTGVETFCKECNHGSGELEILDARFTVWDCGSGKVLIRSPQLRVQKYRCAWLTFGPCKDSETGPDLELSGDGRSALAFWPGYRGSRSGEEKTGDIWVFSWP